MGKQIGGINGPYLGKVGKVVGYQWKGQWVTRAVAEEFHDAKTEKQLGQRGRFKASVAFAARLRDILLLGLKQSAQKARKTEYNYFQMINNGCLAWDGEALVVDYEHLKVSEGPVAPVAFNTLLSQPQAAASSPNLGEQIDGSVRDNISSPKLGEVAVRRTDGGVCITLPFEKNPEHRNCNSNDKVYVAAVNATRCESVLSLPVYRRMRSITVKLPAYWAGEEVHLYGFVQDNAGRTSESVYLNLEDNGPAAADAVEGGADDAADVASTLATGVESGEQRMPEGDLVAGDAHRRRRAAPDDGKHQV